MINSDLLTTLDAHISFDGKAIGWTEILGQLQLFGKLRPFIQEVASQRVMLEEFRSHNDLEVNSGDLDQAIFDYRRTRNLNSEEAFQSWLAQEGLDYNNFKSRLVFKLMAKKLRQKIVAPDLQKEFEDQKNSLEQVWISYVTTDDAAKATSFVERLRSGDTTFSDLAGEPDLMPSEGIRVKVAERPVIRRWLPKELQPVLESASPGELLGPIAMGKQWIVIRVDNIESAQLDAQAEALLGDAIFKRWMQQKISSHNIRLVRADNSESPSKHAANSDN